MHFLHSERKEKCYCSPFLVEKAFSPRRNSHVKQTSTVILLIKFSLQACFLYQEKLEKEKSGKFAFHVRGAEQEFLYFIARKKYGQKNLHINEVFLFMFLVRI